MTVPGVAVAVDEQLPVLLSKLKSLGAWDDVKHDEHMLARFLRARNGDVAAACDMWTRMLDWRERVGADAILDKVLVSWEQRRRFARLYPHGLHGVDNQGRPVLIYRLGATDVGALRMEFPDTLMQQLHVQLYEFVLRIALPACSLAAGRHIDQVTTVVDLEGMGMLALPKVKELLMPSLSVNGDNYPETLAQLVIVNAPAMFDSAFGVAKRLLSPDTQRKITVLGKGQHASLLRLVPRESLPRSLGGTSDAALDENHGPWQQLQHLFTQQATQQPHGGAAAAPATAAGATLPARGAVPSFGADAFTSACSDFATWFSAARVGYTATLGSVAGSPVHVPPDPHVLHVPHAPMAHRRMGSAAGLDSVATQGGEFHSCLSVQASTSLMLALQQRAAQAAVEAEAAAAAAAARLAPQHSVGCFAWLCGGRRAALADRHPGELPPPHLAYLRHQQGHLRGGAPKQQRRNDYEWDDDQDLSASHDQAADMLRASGTSGRAATATATAKVSGSSAAAAIAAGGRGQGSKTARAIRGREQKESAATTRV